MGPGAGVVTMQLPLIVSPAPVRRCLLTDAYQLHTYMTSAANSTCYGNTNDWQHTIFDGYTARYRQQRPARHHVHDSPQRAHHPALRTATSWARSPSTSNLPGWSILHMDLNDETLSYAYDGGSMLNVTTSGAPVWCCSTCRTRRRSTCPT